MPARIKTLNQSVIRVNDELHFLAEADVAPYDPQGTLPLWGSESNLGCLVILLQPPVYSWPREPGDKPRPLARLLPAASWREDHICEA